MESYLLHDFDRVRPGGEAFDVYLGEQLRELFRTSGYGREPARFWVLSPDFRLLLAKLCVTKP